MTQDSDQDTTAAMESTESDLDESYDWSSDKQCSSTASHSLSLLSTAPVLWLQWCSTMCALLKHCFPSRIKFTSATFFQNKSLVGYLMSDHRTHHGSTYECVDQNPEYVSGQGGQTDGALFYFVKPDCDGMGTIGHCPPYGNKQLTCVVCSK